MDGQGTTWRRNIAENFNRLSRVHQRYRQTDRRQTDGPSMTNSEHELEFTFAKKWKRNKRFVTTTAPNAVKRCLYYDTGTGTPSGMTYMFVVTCTLYMHVAFSMFETTHIRHTCIYILYLLLKSYTRYMKRNFLKVETMHTYNWWSSDK